MRRMGNDLYERAKNPHHIIERAALEHLPKLLIRKLAKEVRNSWAHGPGDRRGLRAPRRAIPAIHSSFPWLPDPPVTGRSRACRPVSRSVAHAPPRTPCHVT